MSRTTLGQRLAPRRRISTGSELAILVITTVITVVVLAVHHLIRLGAARAWLVLTSAAVFVTFGLCWVYGLDAEANPDHLPRCIPDAPGMYQGTLCDQERLP